MKYLAVVFFVSALLVSSAHAKSDAQGHTSNTPVALVNVTKAEKRHVGNVLNAFGKLEQAPQRTTSIAAARESQVSSVDVNAGESVTKGQLLLTLMPTPASSAAFVQAQSAETYAETALRHVQNLYKEHLATRDQLAQARQALNDADANLKNAERAGGAGPLGVHAPSAGVIQTVNVSTGEQVAANTTLITLGLQGDMVVRLGVPPQQVTSIRVGMPVELSDVYNSSVHCVAKVSNVSNMVDSVSGLADVFVRLHNAVKGLLPGSYMNAIITLNDNYALAVPRSSVLNSGKQAYIFVVDGDVAHRIDVNILADDGTWIAIKGNIKIGANVVTLGNYELSDGMKIRKASN